MITYVTPSCQVSHFIFATEFFQLYWKLRRKVSHKRAVFQVPFLLPGNTFFPDGFKVISSKVDEKKKLYSNMEAKMAYQKSAFETFTNMKALYYRYLNLKNK